MLGSRRCQRAQQRQDKNKLFSAHAEEVECIAKGKVHKRYEFGTKALFVTTSKNNCFVGAQSLQDNPYDGHTLEGALAQVKTMADRAAIEPVIGHLNSY